MQGVKLGRKEGSLTKMNILEENRDKVISAINKGNSIVSICRKYKVSYSTFYRFRKGFDEM